MRYRVLCAKPISSTTTTASVANQHCILPALPHSLQCLDAYPDGEAVIHSYQEVFAVITRRRKRFRYTKLTHFAAGVNVINHGMLSHLFRVLMLFSAFSCLIFPPLWGLSDISIHSRYRVVHLCCF